MTIKTTKGKAMSWVPREEGEHTNLVGEGVGGILLELLHLTAASSGPVWAVQARLIGFARPATTGITERTFLSTIHPLEDQFRKVMEHGMIPKPVNTFERSPLVRC